MISLASETNSNNPRGSQKSEKQPQINFNINFDVMKGGLPDMPNNDQSQSVSERKVKNRTEDKQHQ